jgi:hypothetical protein
MADLSWWELYKESLLDEFKRLGQFGQQAATAATNADQHWQNLLDIWEKAKKDWYSFTQGRDLDAIRVNGYKLTSRIVTLRAAEDILEDFRVKRLKQRLTDAYDQIVAAIHLMKTGPSTEFTAADPGDPKGAGIVTRVSQRVDDFLTQVENILKAVLSVLELFDFVTQAELALEKKVLTQSNPKAEVADDGFHLTRKT